MRPGHGEVMIAEGDATSAEDRERLVEEFRRQLDQGAWAAVPDDAGRGGAQMVRTFEEIPSATERVIFFPRAAGGAPHPGEARAAGEAPRPGEARKARPKAASPTSG